MKTSRFIPKRYQLSKVTARIVQSGHPWIFRDKLSSAINTFDDGQWIKLFDGTNQALGYGIFEKNGPIGIRVFDHGGDTQTLLRIREKLKLALEKRAHLRNYTDAYRVIHGENDGFPAITFDKYGRSGVLQTYSDNVNSLGRLLSSYIKQELELENVVWKTVTRSRNSSQQVTRRLFGTPPAQVKIHEGPTELAVGVLDGQKSGAFLDLRGLRKWIRMAKLDRSRVLNLFSYTGTISLCAEMAGAKEIWNIDASKAALAFGRKHHQKTQGRSRWIKSDVFEWLKEPKTNAPFDLIICDPPNMVGKKSQVPLALKTYQRLYRNLSKLCAPGGTIIACCCTSRIRPHEFIHTVDKTLPAFKRMRILKPEDDHPSNFAEAEYLKIAIYKRRR